MKPYQLRLLIIIILFVLLVTQYSSIVGIYREIVGDYDPLWVKYNEELEEYDLGAARETLDQLKSKPFKNEAHINYAEAKYYLNLGDIDQAFRFADKLDYSLKYPVYFLLRGSLYENTHQLEKALNDYVYVADNFSDYESMALNSAWHMAIQLGNYQQAEEFGRRLESLFPSNSFTIEMQHERALLKRDFTAAEDAVDSMETLQGGTDDCNWHIERLSSSVPLFRAEIEFKRGDIERAIEIVEELKAEDPENILMITWLTYFLCGGSYYEKMTYFSIEGIIRMGGKEILNELDIEIPESLSNLQGPEEPVPYILSNLLTYLSIAYVADGDLDKARGCIEKGIELNPYNEGFHSLLSRIFWITGDIDGAISEILIEQRNNPDDQSIPIRYVILAGLAPDSVRPDDPDLDEVLANAHKANIGFNSAFPEHPYGKLLLARTERLINGGNLHEFYTDAYESSPYRSDYALYASLSIVDEIGLDDAKEFLEQASLTCDLVLIADYYLYAGFYKSEEYLELAEWVRGDLDPENDFSLYLDNLRDNALIRIENEETTD